MKTVLIQNNFIATYIGKQQMAIIEVETVDQETIDDIFSNESFWKPQ